MSPADAALVERLRAVRYEPDKHEWSLGTRYSASDQALAVDAADAITRLSADAARVGEALAAADDILEGYVIFLHHMPADELEMHPYIPVVEDAFYKVQAARAALKDHSR